MPTNLYIHFNNGTWETYHNNVEFIKYQTHNLSSIQRDATQFFSGAASGKATLVLNGLPPGAASRIYALFYLRTISSMGINNTRAVPLTNGRTYKLKCMIKVPSSNPIGSDDLPIFIGPVAFGPPAGAIVVSKTVLQAKDVWTEVSYTFKAGDNSAFNASLALHLNPAGNGFNTEALFGINRQGIGIQGGVLFIDDITVEDLNPCDLSFGSPAFTKTDETAEDANNGTITVNALGTFTKQYRLNSSAWQSSNIFNAVAPGVYTLSVQDTNGCVLSGQSVTILEFDEESPPPAPTDPAAMSVDAKPVNAYNFISWFSANGDLSFNSLSFSNKYYGLPRAYLVNKFCRGHYPAVVNGEQFSFYINFDIDYNNPNFTSFQLNLITEHGNYLNAVGTLQRVMKPGSTSYYIYASVTLTGVALGNYRLAIIDNSLERIIFVSNPIRVWNSVEAPKFTARFQWRNSSSHYKFLYELIPLFYQEIRLRISADEEGVEGDLQQYHEVTTGMVRNVSYELDGIVEIETYYFDDLAHRAMGVFQVSDRIYINGRLFILKEFYKANRNKISYLSKGKIVMFDQAFSSSNRFGNEDTDLTLIPDSFLLHDDGRIKL